MAQPAELHLFDPQGGLCAVLAAPAMPQAILRAAYSLGPTDVLGALADDDGWELTIVLAEPIPGSLVRPLGFRANGTAPDGIERTLLETALADLWDRGWVIRTDTQNLSG
jgi:hypothetical protein